MKKLLSYINVRDFVTSVAASMIILGMVACGGSMGMLPGVPNVAARIVHLITIPTSGHRIAPNTSAKPFVAAMFFATSSTPSQLAQSYDVKCSTLPDFVVPQGHLLVIPGIPQLGQPETCNNEVPSATPQLME